VGEQARRALELTRLIMGRESGVRVYGGTRRRSGGHIRHHARRGHKHSPWARHADDRRAAPPLNAELDRERGVVVGGYGILQRASPVASGGDPPASRVSMRGRGRGPYGSVISDVSMIFSIRGATSERHFRYRGLFLCLDGRFPKTAFSRTICWRRVPARGFLKRRGTDGRLSL
jgi:hypothetical protein